MFYIGSNVMNWPREAQRAPADGKVNFSAISHKG